MSFDVKNKCVRFLLISVNDLNAHFSFLTSLLELCYSKRNKNKPVYFPGEKNYFLSNSNISIGVCWKNNKKGWIVTALKWGIFI